MFNIINAKCLECRTEQRFGLKVYQITVKLVHVLCFFLLYYFHTVCLQHFILAHLHSECKLTTFPVRTPDTSRETGVISVTGAAFDTEPNSFSPKTLAAQVCVLLFVQIIWSKAAVC